MLKDTPALLLLSFVQIEGHINLHKLDEGIEIDHLVVSIFYD